MYNVESMKRAFLIIFCMASCFCEEMTSKNDIADNIQINAENMEYNTSQKEADAKGNVILRYIVNDTPVILKADSLHAVFDDHGNLVKAIVEGRVEINYKDTKLHATKCIHNFDQNTALCTGDDVELLQDKNELHGKEATLDIKAHVFTMQTDQQEQVSCLIYSNKD